MGKLFWIGNVVVLVAAVALWGVGTLGARDEAEGRRKKVDSQQMEIERVYKTRGHMPNKLFIKAAQVEKQLLRDEKETIKVVMHSRDLNVLDKEFDWSPSKPPPLGGSLADIRQWLEKEYDKKNSLLADAEIIFPAGTDEAEMRGEIENWEKDLSAETIESSLRELVVMVELAKALASASVEVKYVVWNKDTKKDEIKVEPHGVDQMKQVWFGQQKRRRRRREEAEVQKDKPHVEHSFTVVLIAHYNVLPDVMRRVESSKKVLFVTRSVRVKPAQQITEGRLYGAPGAVVPHLRNKDAHEAPVEAEISFGFFEFPVAREARAAKPAAN